MKRLIRYLALANPISGAKGPAKLMPVLLAVIGFALAAMPAAAQGPWPGQPGNLAGYAAAPGWPGSFNTAACTSSPKSGTSWADATVISNCTYSGSGTHNVSCNYCIFEYVDFITTSPTTNTAQVNGSHVLFLGCRFQSNDIQSNNVSAAGNYQYYFYDSFVPLATFYTSPPGSNSWPGAGAGANSTSITSAQNAVADDQGYEYGILVNNNVGPIYVDHCDFWGYGNAITMMTTNAGITLTSNYMHDTASPNGPGYHSDGPNYTNGAVAPNNVTMIGNATGMLGNTNGLALQAANGGYNNIIVNENYWSGDNATISFCQPGSVQCADSTFYGNVFGTDIKDDGAIYRPGTGVLSNSVWACNTISVRAGTSWTNLDGWTPTSAMNGQFFINALPPNSATDQGGNSMCAITSPAAANFGKQGVNSSSAAQTITLSNANSGKLSISSVTLASGSQFTISSNTCGTSLNSGSSCAITVNFSPSAQGPQTDTLKIVDNTPGVSSPQLVPLVGFAIASSGTPPPNPPTGVSAVVD